MWQGGDERRRKKRSTDAKRERAARDGADEFDECNRVQTIDFGLLAETALDV